MNDRHYCLIHLEVCVLCADFFAARVQSDFELSITICNLIIMGSSPSGKYHAIFDDRGQAQYIVGLLNSQRSQ